MFCPKCGTKNPEDGKFCRKCGTDLGNVTDALSGKLSSGSDNKRKHRKENISWDSAIRKLFMGIAFLAVSIVLGFTGAAGGRNWWFWLLIPAFAMMGAGVAQIINLKQGTQDHSIDLTDDTKQISSQKQQALPATQTEYVSNIPDKNYQTGDLVPPSVVENTTRHLEMDKEGETMTLPQDKV